LTVTRVQAELVQAVVSCSEEDAIKVSVAGAIAG
jgi:hypothetical protein